MNNSAILHSFEGDNDDDETGILLQNRSTHQTTINTNSGSRAVPRNNNSFKYPSSSEQSLQQSSSTSSFFHSIMSSQTKPLMIMSPASGGLGVGNGSSVSENSNISNTSSTGRSAVYTRVRTSSMAYPKTSRANEFFTKFQLYARHNVRAMIASVAFVIVLLIITSDALHDTAGPGATTKRSFLRPMFRGGSANSEHWGGAMHAGSFSVNDALDTELSTGDKTVFHFAAVTDLDQLSQVKEKSKPTFQSILMPGLLSRTSDNRYTIDLQLDSKRTLITNHNEAGRGAEFSELTIYNNRLLTFDDRTGDVFEILNNADGTGSIVAPRFVITEGEGDTDKGMKWEWATVKDGELYMGSMGKEYTKPDGTIVNTNNMWIAVLDGSGTLRRIDWQKQYNFVRTALNANAPGYLIMEAILWSDHWNKWIFLPRRISDLPYDDVEDEKRGGNKLVMVDPSFTTYEVVELVNLTPDKGLRGFSSFAFVPGTKDRHAIALRSIEEDCTDDLDKCKQRSYVLVFDVKSGEILSNEIEIPGNMKYEGVEFVNVFTKSKQ